MEILQLKYFRHVAYTENISRTAKEFYVPSSSVSVAIKKLESELGVSLFDRTSNSLKLNDCGKIFLKAVDNAWTEIKKAMTDMSAISSRPSGEINLLILTNRSIVNDAIVEFKNKYPGVSFSITHENCVGYSSYDDFDIIISDRMIDTEHFDKRMFVREEVFLAVDCKNPLSKVNNATLSEIEKEHFICMTKGTSLRESFDRLFEQTEFVPKIAIECNDTFYVCEYMKKGMGVTLFPSVSWAKRIDDTFKLIRIENGVYRDSYLYIKRHPSALSAMFSNVLELCADNNI